MLCLCALAAAGCTRKTDGYCCTSADLCDDVGGVLQECPSGQLCDDDGTMAMGPAHTCIPDPSVQTCADDPTVCEAPTPACVDDICVECDDDLDCTEATDPTCDLDLHRCGACGGPADCARFDPLLTCSPGGACVECAATDPPTQSADCDAADAPICGADGACRGCTDHRECDSGACDVDSGMCVDAGNIAYVDDDASGGNTACTASSKCKTITAGLATDRAFVVVDADSYMEDLSISNQDVVIVAYGADLKAATNTFDALSVGGASGTVTIFGLTLQMSTRGVYCQGTPMSSSARVELIDVRVQNNSSVGVSITDCDFVMTRSHVESNAGGGVDLNRAGFDVTNSVITDNGNNGAFGGVRVTEPRTTPRRLAFNTVVGNRSSAVGFPGVNCFSNDTVPAFHSNIITDNTGSTGGVQVSGSNCTYEDSLIDPAFGGNGNITGDPGLDAMFHISSSSPAREAGRAGSGIDIDYELDPRDATPDIGADEYTIP